MMDNGEIVKEYMLLKTFQDKAMKCRTKKDMLLFCKSFLNKHDEEKKLVEGYPEDLGKYLSTVNVPISGSNMYGGYTTNYRIDLEMLQAGHKGPTYEMVQNQPNLQSEADIRAHTLLAEHIARGLVEKGYIQFDKEIDPRSMSYDYRARLIVGKRSKYT